MKTIIGTLRMIREALFEAARALPRSWPAAVGLALYSVLLVAAGILLGPMGFAGGMVLALIHAGCVGSYLYLVELAITQRHALAFTELQESFGTYLWDVISVLWIFFLAQLVIVWALHLSAVWTALMLVSFFLFNPVPELIYQGNSRSLELLKDAARFTGRSWLEWFPAQLVLLVVIGLLLPDRRIFLLQAFGPGFGFMDVGSLFFTQLLHQIPPWQDIAGFAATVVAVHYFMLFRGFLFKASGRGGRRLRAWQERSRRDPRDS